MCFCSFSKLVCKRVFKLCANNFYFFTRRGMNEHFKILLTTEEKKNFDKSQTSKEMKYMTRCQKELTLTFT